MNMLTKKRHRSVALRLTPIAAGCAVMLSMAASSAFAQQAPEPAKKEEATAESTVVVTGIRRGIEAAISLKKNSSSIIEAISAEDIGKLPDLSVAESIARLPGVTAQRSRNSGKPSDISVRGLAPSFNGALLNGREQASTSNDRSPEFDLFPSELVGNVLIYKTPDSTLIGQGLAATIDLRTVQPLDFAKRQIVVNYRRERTGIKAGGGEGDGNRYSFSFIDQFDDRRWGLALGFIRFDNKGADQQKFNSWGGWVTQLPFNGQQVKLPGGFTADTESNTNDRDAGTLSLQFRPNRDFKSTFDVFYSKGSNKLKKTGLEGAIGGNNNGAYDPDGVLSNVTVDAAGNATSGTLSNYKGVVRNHLESTEDKLTTFGWKNELKLDAWNVVLDLSTSKGEKQFTRYETTAGQPGNAPTLGSISWTGFNGGNFTDVRYTTSLNYADRAVAQLTDVNGWSGGVSSPQAGYIALPFVEDKVQAIRLQGGRDVDWGPIQGFQVGGNYTDRDKRRTGREGRLVINGGNPYGVATVPGSGTAIAGTTGISVVSFDPTGSLGPIYSISDKVDPDILNKDWGVKEKVSTLYIKGDVDYQVFGFPVTGNIGTQVVFTDQKGSGFSVDQSRCTGNTAATCPSVRVSDGTTYTDFLPSLNLKFALGNDQSLRFGAGRQLSRANLDDLRGGLNVSLSTTGTPILKGGGGNSQLKPFKANSLDLSYEKYFGNKGYVSAAGFYKDLDTYILRAPRAFDFAPFIGPSTPLPTTGPFAGSTKGLLTQPFNGDGGTIKGFELAMNIPFSLFTPWLDGLGVTVNYSNTKSKITLPASGFGTSGGFPISIPLPGLSKSVTNARVYYEKNGIQLAAAVRKRSNFLGSVSDFQDNEQLTFIRGDTLLDFQASYEFQGGWFKGLTLLAQANNWTNEPFREYNTSPSTITNRVVYGRTYLLGANYKF